MRNNSKEGTTTISAKKRKWSRKKRGLRREGGKCSHSWLEGCGEIKERNKEE